MFYNCHIHTFKEEDVPRRFLPLGLVRVLATKAGFRLVGRALNYLNPFTDDDQYDRYVKFIKIGRLGSQQKIFEECKQFYPVDTRFVIMPMDMAYMGAGKVPRAYEDQLKELFELKEAFPGSIIPFIHVDPRRPNILQLLSKCVEEWGFRGIKIYPPLGYFPYDDDLDPIYRYAEAKTLPVISHGSPYNPVYFKGSMNALKILLSKAKTNIDLGSDKGKELCANFTHPNNYRLVFNKFPNLKICVAHFGSAYFWRKYLDAPGDKNNWFNILRELMVEFPNLYTDISFTLYEKEFFPLLKVLMADLVISRRILFGSDFYMVETETHERRFGLELRSFLGETDFKKIAVDNPTAFL